MFYYCLSFFVFQVLIHGTAEATDSLAEFCRSTAGMVKGKVFTPKVGELVDATTESHIFQVGVSHATQVVCPFCLL